MPLTRIRRWTAAARRASLRALAAGVIVGELVGALLAPGSAAAQPEPFVREAWTVRDGMPVNAVTALLQSRDGYVWVGTFDGLARFDGVRFVLFNAATSAGLPSNRIVRLTETRGSRSQPASAQAVR